MPRASLCDTHNLRDRALEHPELVTAGYVDTWANVTDPDTRISGLSRVVGGYLEDESAGITRADIDTACREVLELLDQQREAEEARDSFAVGDAVMFTKPLEKFPHFTVPKDASGIVTEATAELFTVKMDEQLPGAEEWDNEVMWSISDGDNPADHIVRVGESVADTPTLGDSADFEDGLTALEEELSTRITLIGGTLEQAGPDVCKAFSVAAMAALEASVPKGAAR